LEGGSRMYVLAYWTGIATLVAWLTLSVLAAAGGM
jgi:hypothetical protein